MNRARLREAITVPETQATDASNSKEIVDWGLAACRRRGNACQTGIAASDDMDMHIPLSLASLLRE